MVMFKCSIFYFPTIKAGHEPNQPEIKGLSMFRCSPMPPCVPEVMCDRRDAKKKKKKKKKKKNNNNNKKKKKKKNRNKNKNVWNVIICHKPRKKSVSKEYLVHRATSEDRWSLSWDHYLWNWTVWLKWATNNTEVVTNQAAPTELWEQYLSRFHLPYQDRPCQTFNHPL